MATGPSGAQPLSPSRPYHRGLAVVLLLIGAGCRLLLAARTFLNPDEALHYFVAAQPSLSQTYTTSLTTAHPPLMFLLLHFWIMLGNSPFFLRLPFVIAGLLFAWTMFLWVERIGGKNAALFSLAICSLSPSLIAISAEVRQYSLLLLFCASSLYALERAFQEQSAKMMALSAVALWLGLLTHYSALIFAAAAGVYGLVRLLRARNPLRIRAIWTLGQFLGLATCVVLFQTQLSRLRQSGVPSEIAATWLRESIFHSGSDHFLSFAVSKTIRLFRYFFSHGSIGTIMLILFLSAVVALAWKKELPAQPAKSLAALLALPFGIALAAAIAGVYPYGGTRHDIALIVVAIAGIAIGLDLVNVGPVAARGKLGLLLLLLAVCNVFASPTPPFILPHNQRAELMTGAVSLLQSQPAGSIILSNYQSGLVLSYYLCGKQTQLPFGPTPPRLVAADCGRSSLLVAVGSQNSFALGDLPGVMREAWSTVPPGISSLSLFQTGWIDADSARWDDELRAVGCREFPNFGANIRVSRCEILSH